LKWLGVPGDALRIRVAANRGGGGGVRVALCGILLADKTDNLLGEGLGHR